MSIPPHILEALHELEGRREHDGRLQQDLHAANQHIVQLETSHRVLENQNAHATAARRSLGARIAELRRHIARRDARIKLLNRRNVDLGWEVEGLGNLNNQIAQDLEDRTRENEELLRRNDELEGANEELEEALRSADEAEEERDEARRRVAELEARLAERDGPEEGERAAKRPRKG